MSWRNVGIIYRKELTDSLRDRRTLISMILVPILLMPALTVGLGALSALVFGQAMRESPRVMVLGGQDSPKVLAELRARTDIRIVPAKPDYAAQILDHRIRAAVEIPPDFDAAVARGANPLVRIYMYEGEIRSGLGADRLERIFRDLRDRTVTERLSEHQLSPDLIQPFRIQQTNVAPPEMVGGAILGGLVPYFVIILCLTGAMYPAMDLTAGEKERGTMETILCAPVSRLHLVLGKFFMVLTASVATALFSVASMGATFALAKGALADFGGSETATLGISISLKAVAAVFLMTLPLAVLFSAALLAISLFAKSYKEAQSYLSPLVILVLLPAVVSVLPGVDLNAALALVPVLNTSLVSKEIVTGIYHWNYILLIFGSSCVYAAAALWVAVRLFQREEVLFRT
jgi:sodium transport system permease protein